MRAQILTATTHTTRPARRYAPLHCQQCGELLPMRAWSRKHRTHICSECRAKNDRWEAMRADAAWLGHSF